MINYTYVLIYYLRKSLALLHIIWNPPTLWYLCQHKRTWLDTTSVKDKGTHSNMCTTHHVSIYMDFGFHTRAMNFSCRMKSESIFMFCCIYYPAHILGERKLLYKWIPEYKFGYSSIVIMCEFCTPFILVIKRNAYDSHSLYLFKLYKLSFFLYQLIIFSYKIKLMYLMRLPVFLHLIIQQNSDK